MRISKGAISRLVLPIVLIGLSMSLGIAQQAAGPEPFAGLKSVADKADEVWRSAHDDLRKSINEPGQPCNPARRQLLERAKKALAERTRSWKEFYLQRGGDLKASAAAAAKVQVDNEAELRTEQENLEKAQELLSAYKLKRGNLQTSDSDGQKFTEAVQSMEEMIGTREKMIAASAETLKNLRDSIAAGKEREDADNADLDRTKTFGLLIETQNRLYESFYRARELRMGLE